MTRHEHRTVSIGAHIVRALRMKAPEDPLERRAQAAFSFMQATIAISLCVNAVVVYAVDRHDPVLGRMRLTGALISAVCIASLLLVSRVGRVMLAGRLTGLVMFGMLLMYGHYFGLYSGPGPFLMATVVLAILAMLESTRALAGWVALYLGAFAYGLSVAPLHPVSPLPSAIITNVVVATVIFATYMIEFRETLLEGLAAVREHADLLEISNLKLTRSLEERDTLSDQLVQAQRLEAMGRMAGSIAHDFNNQLTVIRGYAELISAELPVATTVSTDMGHLVNAVARASGITRDVLDFAAPHPIRLQPTDLTALLRELSPNFLRLLNTTVELRTELPKRPCFAMANPGQLERLLLNLVINARDVMPAGGRITVALAAHGDHIRLTVSDTGPGVAPDMRQRIFEPFFTTKGTTGGSGLGLASSYSIARQHGGTLAVDDAEGGGASFVMDIPSISSVALSTPVFNTAIAPRPLEDLVMVVVEDDAALSKLTVRLLQRAGATVTAFDNGEDAVAHLHAEAAALRAPDCIVTDLRLPRGSGAEVIDAARQLTREIALVAMSGFLEDPIVADLAEQRILSFLAKPFTEGQLLESIGTARQLAQLAVTAHVGH